MRCILALSILALRPGGLWAQEPTKPQPDATELAKASQNPVANLNSVPVQFNFTTGGGLGARTQSLINVQPVLPLAINEKWNLVSRTVLPILSIPLPGGERATGIGDIQEQIFLSPANAGKVVWGVGPVLSFPTATNRVLETGQFAAGPTFVVLTMPGSWVIGAVGNNVWRIGGSDSTTAISALFVQPFINYNLKRGWAISTSPSITANWAAPSGQQWTVPVGIGVSKITMVGKQPINLLVQYYNNVVRPDATGAYMVRMAFILLYPRS
jgi:hypothetical protein